jgi:hypothetical protein
MKRTVQLSCCVMGGLWPTRHLYKSNCRLEGDTPMTESKTVPFYEMGTYLSVLKSSIDRMRNCSSQAAPEHDQDSLRNKCRFGHRFYIGSKRFKLVRLGLAKKEYMCFPGQHPEIGFHHLSTVLNIVGDCAQSKMT